MTLQRGTGGKTLRERSAPSDDQRPVVTIIDDDPMMRTSLKMALEDLYKINLCSNGAEGVRIVDEHTWVVILDIKMADADGFTVYNDLRKKDQDLPIIFHSAYQNLKDPYEIINDYRPFGYLTKGDDFSKLLKVVAQAVEQRRRQYHHRGLATKLQSVQSQMETLRRQLGG